jgi:hypothetical protein
LLQPTLHIVKQIEDPVQGYRQALTARAANAAGMIKPIGQDPMVKPLRAPCPDDDAGKAGFGSQIDIVPHLSDFRLRIVEVPLARAAEHVDGYRGCGGKPDQRPRGRQPTQRQGAAKLDAVPATRNSGSQTGSIFNANFEH